MSLRRYFDIALKWWLLLLLGPVAAGVTAFLISRSSTPIYRASTTLQVNQATAGSQVVDYASLITSQQLAKTYIELMKKRPALEATIANLNLSITPDRLAGQINATLVRDTTLINLSVEDPDPTLAARLANEIAKVFVAQVANTQRSRFSASEDNLSKQLEQLQGQLASSQTALDDARKASPVRPEEVARLESALLQYQNSYSTLLKSYEDLRVSEARLTDSISVAEAAIVPTVPVRPQVLTNTLLAAIVGLLIALSIVLVIEYLDDTLKRPDDIAALGMSNLGSIGYIVPGEAGAKLVVLRDPRSPSAEAFRALRTNIQFASVDHSMRVLLVTSPGPGEGKSTVAANLATALAQSGQKVVLIDADLRRPTVHRIFKMSTHRGLTDLLVREPGASVGAIRTTDVVNLSVIVSGALPPNPAELLGSERVARLLDELKTQFDIIVLDTPPCLAVTDAVALTKRADGVLLVVGAGKTRRDSAQQAVEALRQVSANLLGSVMNRVTNSGRSGYYSYQYAYYSEDGKHERRTNQGSGRTSGGLVNRLGLLRHRSESQIIEPSVVAVGLSSEPAASDGADVVPLPEALLSPEPSNGNVKD